MHDPSRRFDLTPHLRFNIESGHIWLDEQRMMLMHSDAMGMLRRELIDSVGMERARGILLRMGFAAGQRDAELARSMAKSGPLEDAFLLGPRLHTMQGLVQAEMVRCTLDMARGEFDAEVRFLKSWEAQAHLRDQGCSHEPVCWHEVGYASGYTTAFMQRFVVFKECSCAASGDAHCTIVGKPAEDWHDPAYLRHFQPELVTDELRTLQAEVQRLRGELAQQHASSEIIGASAPIRQAVGLLEKAAAHRITVLLQGETGVGKEVFAQWLHRHSPRAEQPFVAINCAAMPHDLVESELFGVERGAYTGAQQSRAGRFERAHGGTLFLDEIGDLSLSAQAKLLRVLQTGCVERLGSETAKQVDVRLVTATHVDLEAAVQAGRFRADLYYRLSAFPIHIPPLRERRSDIPLFVQCFIDKHCAASQKRVRGVSDRAMQALQEHAWPGNVRELENMVERGVLLAPAGGDIEVEHLFAKPLRPSAEEAVINARGTLSPPPPGTPDDELLTRLLGEGLDLSALEDRLVALALQQSQGRLSQAARMLGLTRRQLSYRLKQPETEPADRS
ncbi:MAG: sigma 54-interacting transcriptional regulator [Proteobacteria bacterium]|uniref:sigma 54-interacting transcriptional regulator n=1 Tax=Aquabacterium sp. TaxID=1872578 RepID=UPI0035C697CD|nr:sigma 54-interacting transcriptional regulator [Pseudomonadota bacterium]